MSSDPAACYSSWSLIFASAAGVAAGAGAFAFVSRGRQADRTLIANLLQESGNNLRTNIQQDIVREVNQSMAKTASHFSSSLQSQEREIGKNLKPVAAVPNELLRMNQRLEEVASIFQSAKGRGSFGEMQLENLVRDVFPVGSYEFQCTLRNHKRVDCLLKMPSPIGKLAVDSKFPLDSFRQQQHVGSFQNGGADIQRLKLQKASLRKHINDIGSKYILPGETADCAILFLPSETLFLQVVQDHGDVLLEAHQQKVWIACPTTFMAVLTTLQGVSRGMSLQQETESAMGVVRKLTLDVDRLLKRFEQAEKSLDKAKEDLRLMNVSMEKIRKSRDSLDAMGLFYGETTKMTGTKAGGENLQGREDYLPMADENRLLDENDSKAPTDPLLLPENMTEKETNAPIELRV